MIPALLAALGEAAGLGAAEGAGLSRVLGGLFGEGASIGKGVGNIPRGIDLSKMSKGDAAQLKFDALFDKGLQQQIKEGETFKKRQEQAKEEDAARKEQYGKDAQMVAPFTKAINEATFAVGNRFVPLIDKVLPGPLGQLATATANLTEAFAQRGRELGRYSGRLSAADAVNQTRETFADLRESQALEGPLSRVMAAQNEAWVALRDLLLPIKRVVADKLADYLEVYADQLRALVAIGDTKVVRTLIAMVQLLAVSKEQASITAEASKGILWQMAEWMSDNKDDPTTPDQLEKVFRQWMDGGFANRGRPADRPGPPPGLGVPLFG